MAIKFANIRAAMKMVAGQESVTEAHLQAADDKIALLEQEKTTAEEKLATTEAALNTANNSLKTAQEEKTKIAGDLKTATDKVATLEDWKQKQKATDGREEDDSNTLDTQPEAQESWEKVAASTIASTKKRLGEK